MARIGLCAFLTVCVRCEVGGVYVSVYMGEQKQVYSWSYGERHAGDGYYNNFINSVFCMLTTINLLLPAPYQKVSPAEEVTKARAKEKSRQCAGGV